MKSYTKILLFTTSTAKDLRYAKINSVNPLHPITNKINRYIE